MKDIPRTSPNTCKKCSTPLVIGENWSDGMVKSKTYICRSCNAAKGRKFFAENKQRVIDVARDRRAQNIDEIRSYWSGWRAKNREKIRAQALEMRETKFSTVEGRAARMFSACRARCKHSGIEFNLTKEWILNKLIAGKCEATGIPFDLSLPPRKERGSRTRAFAPSLDRVQCGAGYTTDNVRVTVFIFNVAKSDFSDTELLTLANAIVAKASQQ